MACRNVEKGLEAKKYILSHTKNIKPKIFIKQLDLTSFNSIVKFADTINAEFKEIYALVNNAAVFYHPQGITADGFEITFQTNYLGMVLIKVISIKQCSLFCRAFCVNTSTFESVKESSTCKNC